MQTLNETILELNRLKQDRERSDQIFKPLFYRLSSDLDRAEFQKLLALPTTTICDELQGQLTELMKLRHPAQRLTAQQLENEALSYLANTRPEEYGVWVYYPWSGRLVHILDEEEFIEVRTSRNQYKITPAERDTLRLKKVGVIGLSVGQSVSVTMAMERICGELRLADFDRLELTNLNRIRTGVHNLGLMKVHSVAREVAELDPFIKVVCFAEGLTEQNMDAFFLDGGKLDLVVEESDGFDIKVLSRYKARELQVPVIMEASDRCMVDVERFDLEPDRKILHGILDHLSVEKMKTLTTNEEKIPYMFDILGLDSTSPKLRASMLEMQQTITTWPQLASAVTMGGGITADVARRMMLNDFKGSGRYYVDIDELIGDKPEKPAKEKIKSPQITEDMIQSVLAKQKKSASDITTKELESIVLHAAQAQSFGNEQPWLWVGQEGSLFLFSTSNNHFPALNYKEKYTRVALGACIERARAHAADLGWDANITIFIGEGPLVATITFKRAAKKSAGESKPMVDNPFMFSGKAAVSPALFDRLDKVLGTLGGTSVSWCASPEGIRSLAGGLAAAEKISVLNPVTHQEIFSFLHCNTSEANTGFSLPGLGLPAPVATAFRVVSDPPVAATLLKWDMGNVFSNFFSAEFANSAAFGLVSATDGDQQFYAGAAYEKIRCLAAEEGLAFQPIYVSLSLLKHQEDNTPLCRHLTTSQVRELNGLKEKLIETFGDKVMTEGVYLFRLGKASQPCEVAVRKSFSEIYRSSKQPAL